MLTPEQQADYDYAMSLLEKKEVGNLTFTINADVELFEKSMQRLKEANEKYLAEITSFDLPATKLSNGIKCKVLMAAGMNPSLMAKEQKENLVQAILDAAENIKGATSAQDSK